MRKPGLRGTFWPSERQEALLRAALLPREEALTAWRGAEGWFDLDRLPGETMRLMPLLYTNLKKMDVQTSVLPRLKGTFRRTWFLNQILVGRLRDVIGLLDAAEIPTMVLKGPAIALRYYGDLGERPMGDIDVLVPFERLGLSLDKLAELGWSAGNTLPSIGSMRDRDHAITLTDSSGQICDLHWTVLEDALLAPIREPSSLWWNDGVAFDLGGAQSLALCDADQLLHVIVHGARHTSGARVQWVADAVAIVRSVEIDWDRFLMLAERMRTIPLVSDAIRYLIESFAAPASAEIVQKLEATRSPRRDAVVHQLFSGEVGRRAGLLPFTLARYARATDGETLGRRARGLPRYVQDAWGINRSRDLPRSLIVKTARALASNGRGSVATGSGSHAWRSPHHPIAVPPARVNGVRIDPLSPTQIEAAVDEFTKCGRSHVVHFVSADPTVLARRAPSFGRILNAGDLNLPDGISIVAALRLAGRRSKRVTGSDAMPLLGRWGTDRGIRHYLLGARPGVAEMLRIRLENDVLGMKIVGADSPPLAPIADWDLDEIAERVRASGAELLWIGVGTPKQQVVASALRELQAAPVILCVGAAFDFVSGSKRRPPPWMQRTGLEWLGRLIDEPERLWRRYLIGNAAFLAGAARDLLQRRLNGRP